jgi:predicted dehydrogenase
MNTLLVGTGPMAIEYAKVLKAQNQTFTPIGRGEASADNFFNITGVKAATGGLKNFLDNNTLNPGTIAIIATGTEVLMESLLQLIKAGASKILIEKPAAISIDELLKNKTELEPYQNNIFIAYNRRFYSSVVEAQRLIELDGGLHSMHFEFTEWAHKIEPLVKAPGVKENWFFANSSHVVDLAFFISGAPKEWSAFSKNGKIKWHEKSNFVGAGITDKMVLFSYLSNWESAGRWSIELLTENRRIYLKPLEEVWIQNKGSIEIKKHVFETTIDDQYKPGVFNQVSAFLAHDTNRLVSIEQHFFNSINIYKKMLNN